MPRVRIAAIALATVDGLPESNYARAGRLVEIALERRPDLVLLPEAFAAGYCGVDLAPYAETLESPGLRALRELSRQGQCVLLAGYLEPAGEGKVANAVAVWQDGELLGRHYKTAMWPDAERPYRDEVSLMAPGAELVVMPSRLGRLGVLICYENMFPEKWEELAGRADLILSPYNCEGDPSRWNRENAARLGVPSAWADRTGTVYAGPEGWKPNGGTAGIVDREGREVAASAAGVEEIVVGEIIA